MNPIRTPEELVASLFVDLPREYRTSPRPKVQGLGQFLAGKGGDSVLTKELSKDIGVLFQATGTTLEKAGRGEKPSVSDKIFTGLELATAPVIDLTDAVKIGIFAGPGALLFPKSKFLQATKMEKAGADPQTIWDKTGFFKGLDDKWKFEISDFDAEFVKENMEEVSIFGDVKFEGALKDVLKHDQLFEQYPALKNTNVELHINQDVKDAKGYYLDLSEKGHIYLEASNMSEALRTLLHEIQHKVQYREGFSLGGSADHMKDLIASKDDYYIRYNQALNLYDQTKDRLDYIKYKPGFEKQVKDLEASANRHLQYALENKKIYNTLETMEEVGPYESYRRLGGEVESRLVEKRRKFLQKGYPLEKLDVSRDKVLTEDVLP